MTSRAVAGLFAVVLLAIVSLGTSRTVDAATTRTWTGNGTTNNWSEAANWLGAVAPVAGDQLVFPPSANRKTNNNNFPANTSFEDVTFTGSGYSIDGNPIAVVDDVINQPPSGINVVALNINGSADIVCQSGKLVLSGNNGFNESVYIRGGVVLATSDTALGSTNGTTEVDAGGTLQLSGAIHLQGEEIELRGNGFDGNGALQSLTGANRTTEVQIRGLTTIGVFNSVLVIDSLTHFGTGTGLTLVGGGKLQIESSTLPGPVNVEHGNLTWNGSSQAFVTVQSEGWLRGTGMVSQVDVFGGLVWPGSGNAPGILDVFGAAVFNSGYFRIDIDGPLAGTGYGQLAARSVSLSPAATLLEVDLNSTPSVGDVYRIIDTTGPGAVLGTFLNLPEGATYTDAGYVWKISYKGGTGNDVTITVVRQASADLLLKMTGSPSPVAAGGLIVYTITVKNAGPDVASSPTVSFGTPAGTTYESSTKPANWTCSNPSPSPTVTCFGSAIAAGDTVMLTVTFRVKAATAGSITATAGVSSVTNDPFSADNAATVITGIGAGGSLPFKRYVMGVAKD